MAQLATSASVFSWTNTQLRNTIDGEVCLAMPSTTPTPGYVLSAHVHKLVKVVNHASNNAVCQLNSALV